MPFETYILSAIAAFILGMLFSRKIRSGPSIDAYKGTVPAFDIRTDLPGEWKGFGIIEDTTGRIVGQYEAVWRVSWSGETGAIEEDIAYAAGNRERNLWHLRIDDTGRITITADHVIGEATGKQRGHSAQWKYAARRNVNGKPLGFVMEEWLHAIGEGHVLHKKHMRKFGLSLARMTAGFHKIDEIQNIT